MTETLPSYTDLRDCRVYRFWVTHPVSGEVVLGYVGETVRQPFERLLEHLATQPWFDTVVRWEIDDRVFTGKAQVLRAEEAAIRAERPLYNVIKNERNRLRIPPPEAIRQRRARDARRGRERWVHPDDRAGSVPVAVRPKAAPKRGARRRWSKQRRRLVVWSTAWSVVTLATWITAAVEHQGGWKQTGTASAIFAVLALAVVRHCWRKLKRWLR